MGGAKVQKGGFETAFQLVGGHGRFQWLWLAVCCIQLLFMAWNHLGYIFIGAVPQHWCYVEELASHSNSTHWTIHQIRNISIPKKVANDSSAASFAPAFEQCSFYDINYHLLLEESRGDFEFAYELVHGSQSGRWGIRKDNDEGTSYSLNIKSCQKWNYDQSIYKSTIVTEFDLVCGRRYLVASIQASYMVGAFLGNLIYGPLMDKILGRRKASLLGVVIVLISGFLASFSVSYGMFVGMRFLVAIGASGSMQAFSVWFVEHCDTKSRAKLYCISSMFFGIGYAIMPIYGYFIRDWATLQRAFSITTLSLVSLFWFFPESPRWLASTGKDEEAVEALLRIARVNRMPTPDREDLMRIVKSCHMNEGGSEKAHLHDNDDNPHELQLNGPGTIPLTTKGGGNSVSKERKPGILHKIISGLTNFKSLVATSELRRISFTVWGLFISVAFVYYGFAFSSTNLITSDPYLLVSLGALMEIPASLCPIPFLTKWGRRPTILCCYLLTGLSSLAIAITPTSYEVLRTILSMTGKLFVASAFTIMYLVVSEIYPTVVRSTGRGAGSLMGRLGSVSSPFVADLLTTVYPDLPSIIFGIVALTASLIALFIPEMKDVDMKDQVYEIEFDNLQNDEDDEQLKTNEKLEIHDNNQFRLK